MLVLLTLCHERPVSFSIHRVLLYRIPIILFGSAQSNIDERKSAQFEMLYFPRWVGPCTNRFATYSSCFMRRSRKSMTLVYVPYLISFPVVIVFPCHDELSSCCKCNRCCVLQVVAFRRTASRLVLTATATICLTLMFYEWGS